MNARGTNRDVAHVVGPRAEQAVIAKSSLLNTMAVEHEESLPEQHGKLSGHTPSEVEQ